MAIDPGLRGRVALVTGANQGIGAAAARALAAQGAEVFLTYLRVERAGHGDPALPPAYDAVRARTADAVVEAIRQGGGRAEAGEADLADPSVIPELFDRAEAAFGPVEILVNNAAYWHGDTFLPDRAERFGWRLMAVSIQTCDAHFAVNSRAPALLIAEFARRHSARGTNWGRIISLTTAGAPGFPGEVSYGASKNAVESYTMAAAAELAPLGITANVLSPPPTDTGWISQEVAAQLAQATPPLRIAQPEEVAEVIVFLASQQARSITGQRIHMR
ncbi:MAG TPA: SDR family oxidoreductase [Bryobacteraceae bacterium]|nr:SDR family oxidoreductase [Bryobacteraceae bacterium]